MVITSFLKIHVDMHAVYKFSAIDWLLANQSPIMSASSNRLLSYVPGIVCPLYSLRNITIRFSMSEVPFAYTKHLYNTCKSCMYGDLFPDGPEVTLQITFRDIL